MRLITYVSGLLVTAGLVLLPATAASADGETGSTPTPTVSIEGAVVSPGTFELKPGWGLDDLILAAGHMTVLADVGRIELQRKGMAPQTIDLKTRLVPGEPRFVLAPGDRIVVPEQRDRILLVGVPGGGYRPIVPGQKVSEFFTNSENASFLDTTRVDLTKTELSRIGTPSVRINLKKILKNPRDKQNVPLASGDVIWLQSREPFGDNGLQGSYFLCGMSAAWILERMAAYSHHGNCGHSEKSCCIPVSCREVGNRAFFTQTRRAGCCIALGE
jgi:hypothetical protein